MRPLRTTLVVVAILATIVLLAAPALAGGWAVTALDPLPQRLQAGRTYTVGYWVLQHGSHPYEGDLGTTGLNLVDDEGRVVSFQGVALREPAHFAAAIAIPHAGTWKLYGLQGIFAEYQVGTLTAPGGLAVLRPPAPMTMHSDSHDTHWGAIRPPDVAAMASGNALPVNAADRCSAGSGTAIGCCRQGWCLRSSSGWPPPAACCCSAVAACCGSHRGKHEGARDEHETGRAPRALPRTRPDPGRVIPTARRTRLDDPMVSFKQGPAHRTNVLACSGGTTPATGRARVAP